MLERTPLFAESWNIAWRNRPVASLLEDRGTPFIILKNSFRYWAADPFIFNYNGGLYIFAELYDYIKRKGVIGYCKWNGVRFGRWKKVIEEDYHLSYPYIFEHDGDVYVMPESGAKGDLHLYRAVAFPDKWEASTILRENVIFGDTTPFIWKQHTYALTYDVSDSEEYKLMLLDLQNSENDCAVQVGDPELRRPAGKHFLYSGMHIRPAQNCRGDYGKGLLFYQYSVVHGLFSEKCIDMISPQDLHYSRRIVLDGLHTYNATESFEVIDIKTRRLNLLNLASRIVGKLRRSL